MNNILYWSKTLRHELEDIKSLVGAIDEGIVPDEFDIAKRADWFRDFNQNDYIAFDCRAIDSVFLDETGKATEEEIKNNQPVPRLPFENCVFEFEDICVLANEEITHEYVDGLTDEIVEKAGTDEEITPDFSHTYLTYKVFPKKRLDTVSIERIFSPYGEIITPEADHCYYPENEDESQRGGINVVVIEPDIDEVTPLDDLTTDVYRGFGEAIIGVLSLMEEKLLTNRGIEAPKALSEKRQRKGKKNIYCDYHVLTINVGESRRRTTGKRLLKHESPRLHWRRGHWRTLNRMTEFEKKIWIDKCLVGDPDKGFAEKSYKLVNYQNFA